MERGNGRGRLLPLWQATIFFFALLIGFVALSFYVHLWQIERIFLRHASEDALLVAEVVRVGTEVGVLSREILEGTLSHFLDNTAHFLDHLDAVEPFTYDELLAFIEENRLAGLVLERGDGTRLVVPEGWDRKRPPLSGDAASGREPLGGEARREAPGKGHLTYWPERDLFVFETGPLASLRRAVVAVKVPGIRRLRRRLSLGEIFARLEALPAIAHVSLDESPVRGTEIAFRRQVVEVSLPFKGGRLRVALRARALEDFKRKLWLHFFLVTLGLAVLGGGLSFLFYRLQRRHLEEIRAYEKELALKKEEAAVGRAAATIAHEIRNPLNTMSIALQRLLLEAEGLSGEHRRILRLVLDSVRRTNRTVESLLAYARVPEEVPGERVDLRELVEDMLGLYRDAFQEKEVRLEVELGEAEVTGHRDLLVQVLENLFRNALEALDRGGCFRVTLRREEDRVVLRLANTGDLPPAEALEQIFDPYFTLKTRGCGLGLSLVRKIVLAHGGRLSARLVDGFFEVEIVLPGGNP